MAYGGGIFSTQNKVLPGSYINFVSVNNTDASLSERGVVAMCKSLPWGDGGMQVLTREDFQKNAQKLFAFSYTANILYYLREIFKHSRKILLYNTNTALTPASNSFCSAAKAGSAGNRISVEVLANHNGSFRVTTYFERSVIDVQNVTEMAKLKNNDYVIFDKSKTLAETEIGGEPLTGGASTAGPNGHVNFLNELENYSCNVVVCDVEKPDEPSGSDYITRQMYEEYVKRRRDSDGVKLQLVMWDTEADYEGIVSIKNEYIDGDGFELVYWTAGVCAGLSAGQSAANMKYDGELDPKQMMVDYNSAELESLIEKGQFVLHNVNDEIRVLEDINTLVTTTDIKGSVFKENQTVRICDQIANDIAALFTRKYMGRVPNDKAGRLSLWNDIVKLHEQLQDMRAIEDLNEDDISVERGDSKKSVVVYEAINVVNGMGQLYMTVAIE